MVQPTATLKSITQPFKSFSERDKRDIAQSSYDEKTHAYYYGDWVTALEDLNCVCGINATAVAVDGLEEAVKLATAYANKRRNPDPIGDYLDSVGMPIVTDAERAAFHATPSVAAPVIEPDDSDETPQDVYTTYIRGYVKTGDSEYRNPTQFITLLRNAYTRGYAEKVALRRAQLLAHLDDKNITAEIVKFIKNNEQMVGDTVCQKFNSVMEGEANA